MADQDDLASLVGIALSFAVHLRDERAGGIDHRQPTLFGGVLDGARHAMRAEDRHAPGRDLVELVDEASALRPQSIDDMSVMDDLVTHIDRRAIFFQRAFDYLDRSLNPGAKTSRLS